MFCFFKRFALFALVLLPLAAAPALARDEPEAYEVTPIDDDDPRPELINLVFRCRETNEGLQTVVTAFDESGEPIGSVVIERLCWNGTHTLE